MVEIDGNRLLESLHKLRSFGASGNGVVRPMFSDIDMAARRWLVDEMSEAGLDARIDGVGTVFARSRNPGPAVVIGSHSDTQPEGGRLDGAMGVMYGIEVARAMHENPATAHLAVDVASWADEEGTYTSCLGSRSFVGTFPEVDFANTNSGGESVAEAFAPRGSEWRRSRPARTRSSRRVPRSPYRTGAASRTLGHDDRCRELDLRHSSDAGDVRR